MSAEKLEDLHVQNTSWPELVSSCKNNIWINDWITRWDGFAFWQSHISGPTSELFRQLRVSLKNSPTSDASGDFYKQPACGCAQEEAGSNKDKWRRMQRWASTRRGGMDVSIHQPVPFPDRRSCRRAAGLTSSHHLSDCCGELMAPALLLMNLFVSQSASSGPSGGVLKQTCPLTRLPSSTPRLEENEKKQPWPQFQRHEK